MELLTITARYVKTKLSFCCQTTEKLFENSSTLRNEPCNIAKVSEDNNRMMCLVTVGWQVKSVPWITLRYTSWFSKLYVDVFVVLPRKHAVKLPSSWNQFTSSDWVWGWWGHNMWGSMIRAMFFRPPVVCRHSGVWAQSCLVMGESYCPPYVHGKIHKLYLSTFFLHQRSSREKQEASLRE